jgi:two-component system, OmpR family, response regulator
MQPKTLCLIDDDLEFTEYLSQFLTEQGIAVTCFRDSDDFITASGAFDFEFYVVDLSLPGIDGLDVVRLLRKRTEAGIVIVSARLGAEVFDDALKVGADMFLAKPLRFAQILLAINTVGRRSAASARLLPAWRLDSKAMSLLSPQGVAIRVSDTDLAVLQCFVEAAGTTVTRATLCARLGREASSDADNLLHATIYRLRRRLEQATEELVPLQSQPRVGYLFRGDLIAV